MADELAASRPVPKELKSQSLSLSLSLSLSVQPSCFCQPGCRASSQVRVLASDVSASLVWLMRLRSMRLRLRALL